MRICQIIFVKGNLGFGRVFDFKFKDLPILPGCDRSHIDILVSIFTGGSIGKTQFHPIRPNQSRKIWVCGRKPGSKIFDRNASWRCFCQFICTCRKICKGINTRWIFGSGIVSKLKCHAGNSRIRCHVFLGQLQIDLFRVGHVNHYRLTANGELAVMVVRFQISVFVLICLISKARLINTIPAHGKAKLEVEGSEVFCYKGSVAPVSLSVCKIIPGLPCFCIFIIPFQRHRNAGKVDCAIIAERDLFAVVGSCGLGKFHRCSSRCITDLFDLHDRVGNRIVNDSIELAAKRIGCGCF